MPLRNTYRWGNLQIKASYHTPLYATNSLTGEQYVMDSHGGPYMWLMRCDCGHEWEMPERDFPGRRVMRYCGRPECPHAPKPKPVKYAKAAISAYISVDIVNQLTEYQQRHKLKLSGAVERLLGKALVDALIQEE